MGSATVRPLIIVPLDPFSQKIGGIKSFVADFVRFAPDDFEPEVIGCTADPASRPVGRWQRLAFDNRTISYLPVLETLDVNRRPRIPTSLQFTVATMARRSAHRFKGRVLQFHHPGPPAAFIAVKAPKILTVHLNVADMASAASESRWRRMPGLLHRLEDSTLPRMDRIFVVNRAGVDFYRSRHPRVADRLSFLPTSVDQAHFRGLPPRERSSARSRLLDELGVETGTSDKLALFVGRLEAQKDPVLLIQSIAAALADGVPLRLVVVGDGGLRRVAEQRAAELGISDHVHWAGYRGRDEMPAIMNAADVFLLPSRFEGMPISVLEALACGLPVVASAVGEIPTVVRDSENGRLVANRDAHAFADGLAWVLARPRQSFSRAARAAVAPYSPAATLRPYFEAHRELANRAEH